MFVVIGHFPFKNGIHLNFITQIAVPVFFIISGFLLYNENNDKFKDRIVKNIKNIAQITFWATLLHFTIRFYHILHNPDDSFLTLKQLYNWIIFNDGPYWYFFGYIYVLVIYYFLSKFRLVEYVKYLIPFLILGFILLGRYSYFLGIKTDYRFTQNFLFDGLPFFSIGLLIRENIDFICERIKHPERFLIIFILTSYVEVTCFRELTPNHYAPGFISTAFYAIFLFLTFIKRPGWKESWFSRLGRLSAEIYVFHWILAFFIQGLIETKYDFLLPIWDNSRPIIIVLVTILFSIIFVKVKNLVFRYFGNA